MEIEKLIREQLDQVRATQRPVPQRVISETQGARVVLVDFGATGLTPIPIDVDCYGFRVLKGGSDRMAAHVDCGLAGTFGPVYPGCVVRPNANIKRLYIRPWLTTQLPPAGTFTNAGQYMGGRYLALALFKTKESDYVEHDSDQGGFNWVRLSDTQTYNATSNVPASQYDGVSIRGARGVRFGVDASAGGLNPSYTIAGGTLVVWYGFDRDSAGAGSWGETSLQIPLVTGRTRFWSEDFEVAFESGRLFAELRSYTNSNGSGATMVRMMAFGEGGELNPGDLAP